eukprot:GFYU01006718.1.p1 GENE.GFYU01006718.1~~GFYU01006718.1.p1  ORF type:complete len:256 (+),score=54.96 GFYU01006718.1:55-822(+)
MMSTLARGTALRRLQSMTTQGNSMVAAWTRPHACNFSTLAPKNTNTYISNPRTNLTQRRFRSTEAEGAKRKAEGSLAETQSAPPPSTAVVVVEAAKTTGHLGVIIGFGVAAFFVVGGVYHELIGTKSPNSLFQVALDKARADTRIEDLLGSPITGHAGGRRGRMIQEGSFERNGKKYIQIQYTIEGPNGKGLVRVESCEQEARQIEYIVVDVKPDDSHKLYRFVVEDNRETAVAAAPPPPPKAPEGSDAPKNFAA